MPISFLAPVFLAGLAALAIPVLIHLANRPRKDVVRFPSLMFLERMDYRDASRRRLRNLVLFLLRSLALVLLAAAFARPFVDRPDPVAAAPEGGREVVVLLDRSASMAVGDRMERGREAVREVARGLRRGDRATLVAFDRDAAALHRATDQPGVVLGAVAGVTPGSGGTRLVPALRLAESVLAGTPLPRRELVLVTDFQRSAWAAGEAPRLPPGTDLRLVDVGGPVENTFVADARFRRERFSGRDRVRVAARVATRGRGAEVPVALVLDGRTVATVTAAVPEDGAATVEFDPVTLPDRTVRGTVRTDPDAMAADDAFHFVLSSNRALRVLVVGPAEGGGPYLERALGVGPGHDVAKVRADRLDAGALADVDALVVADDPGPEVVERLAGWVRSGGGLLVVLGPRSRNRSWSGHGLLPGDVGGTRDAGPAGSGLADLRLDHPAFEPFRGETPGLAAARFYRYRELEVEDDGWVLARFGDGAPAMAERRVGRGRVVALASPLDGAWNDLVLQPAFVPLLHGLVRHVSGQAPRPEWRTVGDLLDPADLGVTGEPAGGNRDPGSAAVLLTPSDHALPVRPDSLYRLEERGFYQLRDPRSESADVTVAVNGDPGESEPARVDPEEVRAALEAGRPTGMMASFTPEDRERRQGFWWYALAAAFVLLAAETALSNGLSRRRLHGYEGREGRG